MENTIKLEDFSTYRKGERLKEYYFAQTNFNLKDGKTEFAIFDSEKNLVLHDMCAGNGLIHFSNSKWDSEITFKGPLGKPGMNIDVISDDFVYTSPLNEYNFFEDDILIIDFIPSYVIGKAVDNIPCHEINNDTIYYIKHKYHVKLEGKIFSDYHAAETSLYSIKNKSCILPFSKYKARFNKDTGEAIIQDTRTSSLFFLNRKGEILSEIKAEPKKFILTSVYEMDFLLHYRYHISIEHLYDYHYSGYDFQRKVIIIRMENDYVDFPHGLETRKMGVFSWEKNKFIIPIKFHMITLYPKGILVGKVKKKGSKKSFEFAIYSYEGKIIVPIREYEANTIEELLDEIFIYYKSINK